MKIEEIQEDKSRGISLKIKETKHGKGIFATTGIEEGFLLGFYKGTLREMTPELKGNDKLLRLRKKPGWYPAGLDFSRYNIVDAREDKNNFLKFINDFRTIADRPNVKGLQDGMFYTCRPIASDEQLLTDYGEKWWETYRKYHQ